MNTEQLHKENVRVTDKVTTAIFSSASSTLSPDSEAHRIAENTGHLAFVISNNGTEARIKAHHISADGTEFASLQEQLDYEEKELQDDRDRANEVFSPANGATNTIKKAKPLTVRATTKAMANLEDSDLKTDYNICASKPIPYKPEASCVAPLSDIPFGSQPLAPNILSKNFYSLSGNTSLLGTDYLPSIDEFSAKPAQTSSSIIMTKNTFQNAARPLAFLPEPATQKSGLTFNQLTNSAETLSFTDLLGPKATPF